MRFSYKKIVPLVVRFIVFALLIILTVFELEFLFPREARAIDLNELSNKISQLTDNEEAFVEEIVNTEANIENSKNQITQLTGQISEIKKELSSYESERQSIQKSIDGKKIELEKRIRYAYKYSKNNVIKMLTSARDINEFFKILYLLKNIMKRDAQLVESLRLDKESLDRVMRKSEEKSKEYQSTMENLVSEKLVLEENLEKNQIQLKQVKSEKADVQQVLAAIRERIARIQPPGVVLVGEWTMVATAYYSGGGGLNGDGVTATGLRARKGLVAADPSVIRMGTRVYIEGYGEALVADTGGWIKGNRIDLCFDSLEECYRYGRRKIYVYKVN
jgi:3D (Asp-Asp-Asp) domain-containing protein/peptidoglycan hydrolase CwlO-like protein